MPIDANGTCIQEGRIQRMEERMKQQDEANLKAHRNFYEKFEEEGQCRVRLEEKFNNVMAAILDIKKDLEELKGKPGKRLDSITSSIISALIGAVITYLVLRGGY